MASPSELVEYIHETIMGDTITISATWDDEKRVFITIDDEEGNRAIAGFDPTQCVSIATSLLKTLNDLDEA